MGRSKAMFTAMLALIVVLTTLTSAWAKVDWSTDFNKEDIQTLLDRVNGQLDPEKDAGIAARVEAIYLRIGPDGSDLARTGAEIVRQLGHWSGERQEAKTLFLDSLGSVLDKIQALVTAADWDFGDWQGEDCGSDTTCGSFRQEIKDVVNEISSTLGSLEIVNDARAPDIERVTEALDYVPDLALYGLHRAMTATGERGWPLLDSAIDRVQDAVDAIPDWFWVRGAEERFCARVAEEDLADRRRFDPVFVARIGLALRAHSGALSNLGGNLPDLNAVIVGEGGEFLPNLGGLVIGNLALAEDVIADTLGTFADLAAGCADSEATMEQQIAGCVPLARFKGPEGSDTASALVSRRIEEHEDATATRQEEARKQLGLAKAKQGTGQYSQAFVKICSAYNAIGSD